MSEVRDAAVEQAFRVIAAAALDRGARVSVQEAVDLIDGQLAVIRQLLDVREGRRL